jgi:hypothetical protein
LNAENQAVEWFFCKSFDICPTKWREGSAHVARELESRYGKTEQSFGFCYIFPYHISLVRY